MLAQSVPSVPQQGPVPPGSVGFRELSPGVLLSILALAILVFVHHTPLGKSVHEGQPSPW